MNPCSPMFTRKLFLFIYCLLNNIVYSSLIAIGKKKKKKKWHYRKGNRKHITHCSNPPTHHCELHSQVGCPALATFDKGLTGLYQSYICIFNESLIDLIWSSLTVLPHTDCPKFYQSERVDCLLARTPSSANLNGDIPASELLNKIK